MGYNAVVDMAQSSSLLSRITAAAAKENKSEPTSWAQNRSWKICSTAGWDETWQYAVDTLTVNQNPDIGVRTDVITDAMILSVVQPMA